MRIVTLLRARRMAIAALLRAEKRRREAAEREAVWLASLADASCTIEYLKGSGSHIEPHITSKLNISRRPTTPLLDQLLALMSPKC